MTSTRSAGPNPTQSSTHTPVAASGPRAVTEDDATAARAEVARRAFVPSTNRLPNKVLPVHEFINVVDQGRLGLSVGVATAATLNYLRAQQGESRRVSGRMLYEYARAYDEYLGVDHEGSSMLGVMAALWRKGVCLEDEWPLDKGDVTLTPEVEKAALDNRPQAILRVEPSVEHLRAAVFEHGAIVVGATVHTGWQQPGDDGVIPFTPHGRKQTIIGGHAFAVIGYTERGFLIQNSWGLSWTAAVVDGREYPGVAIWRYEDAIANTPDAWVLILTRKPFRPPLAGYDSDSIEGADLLEIRAEVNAFAYVLASTSISPPLAIGLFGDWGSGKSFFMRQMLEKITALAKVADDGAKKNSAVFCQRVVQVRFNAWHYLDTDLWASLVTEIFDKLFAAIGGDSGKPEGNLPKLAEQLQAANGVYQQAKLQLEDAERARNAAEEALKKAAAEREAHEGSVAMQLNDLATLVGDNAEVRQNVDELATDLGVPKLRESYEALDARAAELDSLGHRFVALLQAMFATPWGWQRLATLIAALVAPVLAVVVLEIVRRMWGVQIADFHSFAIQLSALLAAITAWLGAQAKRGNELLTKLEGTHRKLETIREARRREATAAETAKVQSLREKEDAARKSVQDAEQRVQTLKREVADLQPGRLILRFIEERTQSSDYRSRLGIVSLVRRDFERLSELADPKSDNRDPVAMPIERIILYIDDLDRCSPERVIDVLEAVHLLLTFKLFMVVVAVDPRWLRRCLETRYPDLLALRTQEVSTLAHVVPSPPATAQDYLEKIFQIPFSLQPLKGDGYRRMLRGLTAGNVVAEAVPVVGTSLPGGSSAQGGATVPVPGVAPATSTPATPPLAEGAPVAAALAADKAQDEADDATAVERLTVRAWELEDMERLAPLFRTPRSVKRFVNSYRFLRAGVRAHELPLFEGTREEPGTSRAAMVLLAVVVGYPNVAARFLQRISDTARVDDALAWKEFLDRSKNDSRPHAASSTSPKRTTPGKAKKAPETPKDWEEVEWRQLCSILADITEDSFPVSDVSELTSWIRPVARYSFSLSAMSLFE